MAGAVARLGSLLSAVIVGRKLGRSDFGRYAAAVAIGAIVVAGPGGGLPSLALRDLAAQRAGRKFVVKAVQTELLVTLCGTVLAVLVATAFMGDREGPALGLTAGLANIALVQTSLATAVGVGVGRYRLAGAVQIALGVALPILTLAAVRAGLGVIGAVGALGLAATPCSLGAFWFLRASVPSISDEDPRRLFRRSKSFLGLSAVNGGYQRVDSVIMLPVAGPSATGVYASAYRLLGPFDLLEAAFAQVFFPRLARMERGDAQWVKVRQRGTRLYCLAIIPAAALTALFMPPLIVGIFGRSFRDAITPARILLVSLIPSALYWPKAIGLAATGRETTLLYIFALSISVDAFFVAVLAGPLGAAGAAWAWVAAECASYAGVLLADRRGGSRDTDKMT